MEQKASAPQAKSTAHVGHANYGTEGTANRGARVGEGRDGKARDWMPCTAEIYPARRAEVQPVAGGGCHAATAGSARVRGAGAESGMRVNVARMQAAPAPQPPSPTHSAASAVVSSPSSQESPETVQQEGRRTAEQERKGEAAAGTGQGGDKEGQALASGDGAEVAAAGAGGNGEERGEHAAASPRGDPFNLAESDRLGGSVVADILVVSEDEGEEARRMALEGGQGQPTASNVRAAAIKSILP